jgi:hypothetical protein
MPLLLLLLAALPASAQDYEAIFKKFEPLLCVAPDAKLKGKTDFYGANGYLLHTMEDGAQADAVAVVPEPKLALFKAVLERKCADGKVFNAAKLRELAQPYAIHDLIAFDAPANREKLENGLFSETKTFLYKGKDGLVHHGREKIVSGDGTIVTDLDPNKGGAGFEDQGQDKILGKMHTHPNSDNGKMFPIPSHKPSPQDVSSLNDSGYYDVVLSPLYVYFINHKQAKPLVIWREQPFGDNPVKKYLIKDAQAEAHYALTKKYPSWWTEDFNKQNNPWAR